VPGGESEQICERCTPRGFSSDGAVLLFNKFDLADGNKDRIVAMNLRERTEQDFLSDPKQSVYNANFSRDDRWVAFRRASIGGFTPSQILIAPVQHGVAADAANWVKVTDTTYNDDQPQFSADGNTLYFTSDRDGYLCIWVQRLDPHTKHPIGAAVAYEHFHNSAGHDGIFAQRSLYLSVARDKILINLLQARSELWITKME
jgi:Tol biopolymer transport system component